MFSEGVLTFVDMKHVGHCLVRDSLRINPSFQLYLINSDNYKTSEPNSIEIFPYQSNHITVTDLVNISIYGNGHHSFMK